MSFMGKMKFARRVIRFAAASKTFQVALGFILDTATCSVLSGKVITDLISTKIP